MTRSFANYVNGAWSPSATGRTLEVRNPARTDEVVATCAASDAGDARAAVDAAAAAFPAWAATPAPRRGAILSKAAQVLARRRDEAAELLTREEGKILAESRGEVDRAIALLEFYAGQTPLLAGQTLPSAFPNRFLYTLRVPLGPLALITPWNFPIAIPTWKAAPALACGNTVVIKPAAQAPVSACLLAECLHEAGLPPGVFNLVTGAGSEVGEALTSDARIRAISFTGSLNVGRSIARKCAERLIRVGLEMGGKNAHVVLEDADLDRAVNDVMVGAFWGAGHKCTACSRALVAEGIYEAFLAKLVEKVGALRVGDGLDPQTQIPPMIDEHHARRSLEFVEQAQRDGARLLVGGRRLAGGPYDRGAYLSPAVLADVKPSARLAREEVFGPVLAVMSVRDLDEALAVANDAEYGLSAGLSTRSLDKAIEFARRCEAGVLHVNNPTAGLEPQAPFGGFKGSSSGYREMGTAGIEFYSNVKTVYVDV